MTKQEELEPSGFDGVAAACRAALAQIDGELTVEGLSEPVEVLRDRWGVPHIYARNQADLFFAQGFVQAQDRLWQMELWRREAEGRIAEIAGPDYVARDKLARLLRYRGDMDAEWRSYRADAREVVTSFVAGVNAFIKLSAANPPVEFQILGIRPNPWTPEVCLGRMAGFVMCRNASTEVMRTILLREVGPETTQKLLPASPEVSLSGFTGDDYAGVGDELLRLLSSLSVPVRIPIDNQHARPSDASEPDSSGSNNWVVAGGLSVTGMPILANDPHRLITLPSLRYVVHLVCPAGPTSPGWNVVGGSEPAVPGITIGHNERIAWGFTIVNTDQQDLYLEETHPDDSNLYRAGDRWIPFDVEREEFKVLDELEPRTLELKFSRHGPIVQEDLEHHRAIALRWSGSEPGGAGYLASLAVDTTNNWPEFLSAVERWHIPSSNLVYADVEGHVAWIAAALTPIRQGWEGILPVPGWNGSYEWNGWLQVSELPQTLDPQAGYIATANHDIRPDGYRHLITHDWSSPFRFQRIDQVLSRANQFTVEDFRRLQQDATSIPAGHLIGLLLEAAEDDASRSASLDLLSNWDCVLDGRSEAAALYELWLVRLVDLVVRPRVPERLWQLYSLRSPVETLIQLLDEDNDSKRILNETLAAAVADLERLPIADRNWGALHQAHIRHMFSPLFNLPSVPRGGDSHTLLATAGPGFDQTSGASYAHVMDVSNWDNSVAINGPGQSGQPGSPHYGDLLTRWAEGSYFRLAFGRQTVEANTEDRLMLLPR